MGATLLGSKIIRRLESGCYEPLLTMLCQLCECEDAHNFHHLIPRTLHSNKWFKKRYSREELRRGLWLCGDCHKTVHREIAEKELGRDYNTREKLLGHDEIAKYVAWRRRRLAMRVQQSN